MADTTDNNLESIALKENSFKKKILHGIKKSQDIFLAFWWYGGQKEINQIEPAGRIGLKPKNTTITNSLICGLPLAYGYYQLGNHSLDLSHLDFIQRMQSSAVSYVAHLVGISTRDWFYGLSALGFGQSLIRPIYSLITNDGLGSISIAALVGNEISSYMRKRKPVEGVEPSTPG